MSADISIIIPVYNEQENILPITRELTGAMKGSPGTYEIVFVDDCSTDATWDRIQQAHQEESRVHGLRHSRNCGQSAALWTGFQATSNPVIATLDGDLQNDAADILTYKEVVESGGYHGVRMVFNVSLEGNLTVAPGNQVMRISQVALVDPATSLLYLLVVRCSAACYKANQTAIDQIISSFTVRAH